MGIIFYFSSQSAEVSLNTSGKVLVTMDKLEKDEVQSISDRRVWNLQNTIRKYAHFVAYFVLGLLMTLSFVLTKYRNYTVYLYSWLVASLYGVLDEFHQSFVPGRGAMLSDIFLDSVSAIAGTIFVASLLEGWKWIKVKRGEDLLSVKNQTS